MTQIAQIWCLLLAGVAAAATPEMPGKLVDVGGYRVHLYCTGTGSPAVVVVGGGFSFDWGLIQPEVARFARICTYDPSGTAWSDPFPRGVPQCADRVEEIHQLLNRAPVAGPYVLVGYSIGGLYARLYAHKYAEEAAGVVIVDHAFIPPPRAAPAADGAPVLISQTPIVLGLEDDENFARLPQRNQELHRWAMAQHPLRPTAEAASECMTEVGNFTLGGTPLIVISTPNDSADYQQLQRNLLALSSNSKQLIAEHSSHMVIVDQPEIVVTAIRQIVTRVRK